MKKIIILSVSLIISSSISAQLKVDSIGAIQIGAACYPLTDDSIPAKVAIGDNIDYIWGDFHMYSTGVLNCKSSSPSLESIGLYSEVSVAQSGTMTQPYSTGLWGLACGSTTSNFGVVGGLNGSTGAGIYGSTGCGPFNRLYGSYAGYFDDDTYVNGNLTTAALYNLSDMRLKKNVTLLSENASIEGTAIDHLQKLNVIEYNLLDPVKSDNRFAQSKHFAGYKGKSEEELSRRHYGLSAQELQEIYPNLVLKGQDGYLAVNYVELVPILIRSIQELKQELDEVRSPSKARELTAIDESAVFGTSATGNVLYQNTPNPFKENTIIRFKLADNVSDATICIFDMTGKTLKKLPVSSGMESVSIGGYELGEGMFLYSLIVNGQVIDTKRMIISK